MLRFPQRQRGGKWWYRKAVGRAVLRQRRTHLAIARRRSPHRLHRAEDRHLRAARHRHAERLPDVSGRAQRHARWHQGHADRRGQARASRTRPHPRQQADPVPTRCKCWSAACSPTTGYALAPVGHSRRRCSTSAAIADRGRSRASATFEKISLHGEAEPIRAALAAGASARAMGLRAGLQDGSPHRRRLCLRPRNLGGFQKAFEDCGGKIVQKIWPPIGTKDSGPTFRPSRATSTQSFADGRADVAAVSEAAPRLGLQASRSSAAAPITTSSSCRRWTTG